jgi:competence protein ComEA
MRRIVSVLLLLALSGSASLGHELVAIGNPEASTSAAAAPLNLNAATLEQLDQLPGIGPAMAERIVAYRDEHGPFTQLEQLDEVKGIGPRTLAELRPRLTLE